MIMGNHYVPYKTQIIQVISNIYSFSLIKKAKKLQRNVEIIYPYLIFFLKKGHKKFICNRDITVHMYTNRKMYMPS